MRLELLLLTMALSAGAQTPPGFHWVDFKRQPELVAKIEKALLAEDYSAIREIGIAGDAALVFTSERIPGTPLPEADLWRVYNISLPSGETRQMLGGYQVELKDWLRFEPRGLKDLGVTYLTCWECEPTSMFTALHYDNATGWRARWPHASSMEYDTPGLAFCLGGAGYPYDHDNVDQVFAVLSPAEGHAAAGSWYYALNTRTGVRTSTTVRYSVDPASGADRSETLTGRVAAAWQQRLCAAKDASHSLLSGQTGASCKGLARKRRKQTHAALH